MDARDAGEGSLEILVVSSASGKSVPAHVAPVEDGAAVFAVTFAADKDRDLFPYLVNVTFNDENVPGKNWRKKRNQTKAQKKAQT